MNVKFPAHRLIITLSAASWLAGANCALAQENLTETVGKAEKILLGASQNTGTVEERLSTIEQKLYGKPKKGPLLRRMQAVAEMLRIAPASASPVNSADNAVARPPAGDAVAPSSQTYLPYNSQTASEAALLQTDGANPSQKSGSQPGDTAVSSTSTDGETAAASTTDRATAGEAAASMTTDRTAPSATAASTAPSTTKTALPQSPAPKQETAPAKSMTKPVGANAGRRTSAHPANVRPSALVELKPQDAKMDMPPLAPSIHKVSPNLASSAKPPQSEPSISKQDLAKNLLRQGLKLHAQGQTQQAERLFRRVLAVDPRNADAFFNLGSLAEARKDLITALTDYRAALNLKPGEHDFQTAVSAIERELNENSNDNLGAGEPSSQRFSAPTFAPDTAIAAPDTAMAAADTPIVGTGSALTPFQLKSAQNNAALLNLQPSMVPSMNMPSNMVPSMNVSSPLATPTLNVSSPTRNHSTFSAVLSIGAGLVLRGSGLHCPICRIMSGF